MGARPFQGYEKRFEKFMGEKFRNVKTSHLVAMVLETNPPPEAPGLRVRVTGETLQRAAVQDGSVFMFFPRASPRPLPETRDYMGP